MLGVHAFIVVSLGESPLEGTANIAIGFLPTRVPVGGTDLPLHYLDFLDFWFSTQPPVIPQILITNQIWPCNIMPYIILQYGHIAILQYIHDVMHFTSRTGCFEFSQLNFGYYALLLAS